MNIIPYLYNNGVPNMPMIHLGLIQGPWTSHTTPSIFKKFRVFYHIEILKF
jgi:hypothetical protein